MFHVTLFGGTQGDLPLSNFISLTLFGSTELRRPTLARRILHLRASRNRTPPSTWARLFELDRNILVTLFGGTEIHAPTLMEEYSELRGILASKTVSPDEAKRLIEELTSGSGIRDLYTALTLFGSCEVERPEPKEEKTALESAVRSGILKDPEYRELDAAVGQPEPTIYGILGRLALAGA